MATTQILSLFSTTLERLTPAELSRVVFIEQNTPAPLSAEQKKVVYQLAGRFYRDPSPAERELLLGALELATVEGKPHKVLRVAPGTDLALKITPAQADDYTGFKLVARSDATGELLSNGGHDGTNAPVQYLHLIDLAAEPNSILKVRVQLEEYDLQGVATGQAVRKLGELYLLTDNDIDTE
jgi:hypothetical protein